MTGVPARWSTEGLNPPGVPGGAIARREEGEPLGDSYLRITLAEPTTHRGIDHPRRVMIITGSRWTDPGALRHAALVLTEAATWLENAEPDPQLTLDGIEELTRG